MLNWKTFDISIPMDGFTFPGNPLWQPEGPFNRVEGQNPEFVYDFRLCSQSGTHIQGAHYFSETGKRLDQYPLEAFEGWAYITDINSCGDISLETIKRSTEDMPLKDRILILRTGHMDQVVQSGVLKEEDRVGLSPAAARYLCQEKQVKMIAIDSVGVESRCSENYEVNVYLCSKEILILECIGGLSQITASKVWLEAFPLKINGTEGSPCRAVVKVPVAT